MKGPCAHAPAELDPDTRNQPSLMPWIFGWMILHGLDAGVSFCKQWWDHASTLRSTTYLRPVDRHGPCQRRPTRASRRGRCFSSNTTRCVGRVRHCIDSSDSAHAGVNLRTSFVTTIGRHKQEPQCSATIPSAAERERDGAEGAWEEGCMFDCLGGGCGITWRVPSGVPRGFNLHMPCPFPQP